MLRNSTIVICSILACCLFGAQGVAAQQAPDAGMILREQPEPQVKPVAPKKIEPEAPAAKPTEAVGPKILVKGFRIKGAVLISEAELQTQLKEAIGKEYTLDELQSLALYLVGYYIQQGHIARVIVPPQEIRDGIVEIRIIEGKRGSLNIDNKGKPIDTARVQGFIDERLPGGAPMSFVTLGEAMNILNEQPGIEARVGVTPGKGEGEIDLNVSAAPKPLVTGRVGVNNHGTYSVGRYQAQGSVTLNNPTGRFDAASILVNASEGSIFGRADYSLAVGNSGLRVGANASYLDYEVTLNSMKALDMHGYAGTVGLDASYPLARRTDFNLSLGGSYDHKELVDKTIAGETGDRRVDVLGLSLGGHGAFDNALLSGGVTTFGLTLSFGDTNQENAGALATDKSTRQTEGSFTKLNLSLGHIRPIGKDWNITADLRGQLASKNLDSSERMSLGGPGGVRAYPVGEAVGDEGWILNLVAGRNYGDTLKGSLFLDAGGIKINHDTWTNWNAGNTRLDNSYELCGVGAGIDWRFAPNALLNITFAVPVGSNPGRDANNRNNEGHRDEARLWFSLNAQF